MSKDTRAVRGGSFYPTCNTFNLYKGSSDVATGEHKDGLCRRTMVACGTGYVIMGEGGLRCFGDDVTDLHVNSYEIRITLTASYYTTMMAG